MTILMKKLVKRKKGNIGQPPGTLIYTGEKKTEKIKISILDYDEENYNEVETDNVEDCFALKEKKTVTWINIDGLHDLNIIEKIGKHYGLHPLVLEDIVHTTQRPKIDDHENYIYLVIKMISREESNHSIEIEQVSLIMGPGYVISFQEKEGDVFHEIRERIRSGKGRIRKMGADYLAYALLDAIVDNYFIILEAIGDKLEALEEELLQNPTPDTSSGIFGLKSELIFLRRSVWPLRELINGLERGESGLIKKTTIVFLRDLYDHTIQVMDTVEAYRDVISGMRDTYLSSISNRMNEVMKVLTLIATIFIPLTFIAGIYGMNFQFMPELSWRWSYPIVWGVMVVIGIFMLFFFRKKKWL
jgi:magnesium transporter